MQSLTSVHRNTVDRDFRLPSEVTDHRVLAAKVSSVPRILDIVSTLHRHELQLVVIGRNRVDA
jgi:hypothetical protein